MVFDNLESLSMSELRNLAEQEGILEYQEMDKDDLIAEIVEKYDESYTASPEDTNGDTLQTKYVNSFSDYKAVSDSVSELPGVEELPEMYEETSIHLLSKNSDWGYAFWSVSTLDKEKLQEKNGEVYLSVSMGMKNGTTESYDILVNDDDHEWNIGFSSDAVSCSVSLAVTYENGKHDYLAVSKTLELSSSYWLDHKEEIKENDELFKTYLSLLTTKKGDVISNSIVKEILAAYCEGDVE